MKYDCSNIHKLHWRLDYTIAVITSQIKQRMELLIYFIISVEPISNKDARSRGIIITWWRHQMKTFSALLSLCVGNSPVPGEFPSQRPVTRSFDVFFDLHLNKRLSKQSWGWWFQTSSCSLWRHCYDLFFQWRHTVLLDTIHFHSISNMALLCCNEPCCNKHINNVVPPINGFLCQANDTTTYTSVKLYAT